MRIIRAIRYILGLSGANFTRKEKDHILEVIKEYDKHVFECQRLYDECDNMTEWLYDRLNERQYKVIITLWHNYKFYSNYIKNTREGVFMWSRYDYQSRFDAIDLLRNKIIND